MAQCNFIWEFPIENYNILAVPIIALIKCQSYLTEVIGKTSNKEQRLFYQWNISYLVKCTDSITNSIWRHVIPTTRAFALKVNMVFRGLSTVFWNCNYISLLSQYTPSLIPAASFCELRRFTLKPSWWFPSRPPLDLLKKHVPFAENCQSMWNSKQTWHKVCAI